MTDIQPTEKVDPETLVLRAKPRRVVRFKRNVLVGVAAIGCLALVGITWLGLRPPAAAPTEAKELYDPDKGSDTQKPKPERLANLPKSYADLPAGVPALGPPLPGDLGKPMLEAQRSRSVAPTYGGGQTADKGVFFQVNQKMMDGAPAASAPVEDAGLTVAAALGEMKNIEQGALPHAEGGKIAFLKTASTGSIYNPHIMQTPASPYQIMAGTVLSASLVTGLNSDLPGMVIAQLSEPAFDTVSGRILLAPQGTRLIGEYDSDVTFGQSRALVVWKRMILPNGTSLEIDNLPATDMEGYAGLADRVDFHTWSLVKGIGLSTLLGLTGQVGDSDDSDLVKALREATRQNGNQAGQQIVQKQLSVQPTIKVRPGWPLRIIVHKDLILKPYASTVPSWPN